tara:strand:+ start:2919 stop:3149 length:231 start_codon:yes stop_codon:yes gene_type:complete
MKYEEFMKITNKWSDNDVVCFLMEYPWWNDVIMSFIYGHWEHSQENGDITILLEEIVFYAQDNNILEHTDLPEVEE